MEKKSALTSRAAAKTLREEVTPCRLPLYISKNVFLDIIFLRRMLSATQELNSFAGSTIAALLP